jgi:hypothetical protein
MNRASHEAVYSSKMCIGQGNSKRQPGACSAFSMEFVLLKKQCKLLIITNYLPLALTTTLNAMLRFIIRYLTMT